VKSVSKARRAAKREIERKRRIEERRRNFPRWIQSPERRRSISYNWIVLSIGIVGAIVAVWVAVSSHDPVVASIAGISVLILFYILVFVMLLWSTNARRLFDARIEQEDRQAALVEAESNLDTLEIGTLWAANQKRVDFYHSIATTQSQASFRNGTFASIVGFAIMILVAVFAAFAPNPVASISAGAVGIAGAAMSAYIGATFIRLQSDAATQLRQFFLQPVEFSRLLSAERLIDTLPETDRAAAVQQVIAAMTVSHAAPAKTGKGR
jgi:MFS family permease